MSDEKQETTVDILREMREGPIPQHRHDRELLHHYATRLEAAHRREAAFHAMTCEANERLREHLQIALDADKREHGDYAKLREALDRLAIASEGFLKTHSAKYYVDTTEALGKAKTALAAPPRNCDVYDNVSCRMAYHLHGDGLMTMQAFADWLFAPATEQEGGAK